jgi:phosphoribosylanthranilate isomerase
MNINSNYIFEQGFIQIAGVLDKKDAFNIIDCGIKFLGFPLVLDHHKEDLNKDEVKDLIRKFPTDVLPVLITYLNTAKSIKQLADYINVDIIQIHGNIELEQLKFLRKSSDLRIIKSIIIHDKDISKYHEQIKYYQNYIDAFITDTFDPLTGASGATGISHDRTISKKIKEFSSKPIILAGGVNPDNVHEDIILVRPNGVDSHTGVEDENGRKSKNKLIEFKKNAELAFKNCKNDCMKSS